MSERNSEYYFLKGGGVMGELIRAKDWSKTPLGDPANWPQSLQTMVAVMLDNPFGMYIAWGSEYIQLYNDGYRPILGATKHPKALGISTKETFSEIWHIIESMFDGVMKGTAVGFPDLMLPLERNGFVEECYFDFAYSPIRKDNGEVGGVLVTVIETTDKKKSEAALLESTDQLKFAMDAAELGTWDYNPATNKFTANNLLRIWFGLSASEQIELHHATDAIAEKDRDRIIAAIKKALDYSSGGIYEEEYSIINPVTKKEIIVQGKGRAWFNEEGIAYRFNGVLQDVTENVLARKKIEDNEEQLRIAIEGGEFGTFDFFPKTNQLIWSDKTKELFGLPPNATVSYDTYIAALHPEDRGTSRAIAQQQANLKDGGLYELEYRTIGITDGKLRWLRSKGKATYNKEGEAIRYTGVIQDITKQKESAEKIRESNQWFRNTMKQAPIGITILRGPEYIVEMANDAYLQLIDKKEAEFVGNPLFDILPEVQEAVHALLDNVIKTGVPYHGNEVPIPLNRYGKQDVFYFDFLYHPLKEDDGKISGVIAIVTEVTEKVVARTAIEVRKRLYETITQNTPDLIYVFDLNNRFTYANEALLRMWGRTWDDAIGKGLLEVGYEPWHAEMHEREIVEVIATKKPIRGEVSFPHATLGERIYDYIFAPVINEKGEVEAIMGTTRDITQLVEARKRIELNEEKLNIVIEASELGTWEIDVKTNTVTASRRLFDILGFPQKNKFMLSDFLQHVHPEFIKLRTEAFNKAYETGLFYFAAPIIRDDNSIHWVENKGKVFYDEEKNPVTIIGTTADITEEKLQQQILSESEQRFRLLADSMPQHIWTADPEGNLNYYNQSVFDYSGLTPEQINKDGWIQIVHPDDKEENIKHWVNAVSTGKDFLFEHRFRRHDGEYRWQLSRAIPQRDETGKIQMWVGTSTDIEDQKIFAKELEGKVIKRTAELKASEEKFYTLFNLSPISKTLSDTSSGKIVMINDAFTKLFGYSREMTLGKSSAELGLLDLEEREIIINELKTKGKIENREIWFIKKSGEKFIALASAELISIGDKQFFLSAFSDISEVKKAEQKVKQKNVELEKMNNELASFAYISSHDLQEPLRKIQTFASRISTKEENNLSEYGKELFQRMQGAAKRMQTLIQDLLAYSRTTTEKQVFKVTDLKKIILEVKEDLKEELSDKHAIIETGQLCEVNVIPFQFRQLMYNLISNSLKFSGSQNAPLIKIKSEIVSGENLNNDKLIRGDNYCHISVSDNGIGFEPEYREKIFEVFQRLHGKSEYDGTGIGLAIVKKIVENHHGIITAYGVPNKGSTFDIYIPVS